MLKPRLQQASFRGIKFFVAVSEETSETTYAIHRFPGELKRPSYAEFIAEEPRILPLEAFLMGDDRHYTLSLLRQAKSAGKPGKLLHPQLGILFCYLRVLRTREEHDRIGKILIKMEFIDAPENFRDELGVLDKLSQTISDAKNEIEKVLLEFTEMFSVVDLPAQTLSQVADLVYNARNAITSTNGLAGGPSALESLYSAGDALVSEAMDLLLAPDKLGRSVLYSLGFLRKDELVSASQRVSILSEGAAEAPHLRHGGIFMGFLHSSLAAFSGLVLAENIGARKITKIEVNQSVNYVYEMVNLALPHLRYERQLGLKLFVSRLREWAAGQSDFLHRSHSIVVREETPALLLSYQLYGSLAPTAELIRRNNVANPAAMCGELEVTYE